MLLIICIAVLTDPSIECYTGLTDEITAYLEESTVLCRTQDGAFPGHWSYFALLELLERS